MEALPIFLDTLVPPYVAVLISVTLILAFGEVTRLIHCPPLIPENYFPLRFPDE
jgi:hypothetical protein